MTSFLKKSFYKAAALGAVFSGVMPANNSTLPSAEAATITATLTWERNDSNGIGSRVYAWPYNGQNGQRVGAPTTTDVPDTAAGKSEKFTFIMTDGQSLELAVTAYTLSGESGFSNSVYPLTQGDTPMQGSPNQENTFFLSKAIPAFLYGGGLKDVVLVRGQANYVNALLYDGDDFVEGGGVGSVNIFDLGAGNDTFNLNGGANNLVGGGGQNFYNYTRAQMLSPGSQTRIADFNPATDIFTIQREALEEVRYFPQSDATHYLGFKPEAGNTNHIELWVNPWGYGFGAGEENHMRKAATFLNAAPAFLSIDPSLNSINLVTDLIATGNLKLNRDYGEVAAGKNQYFRSIVQNVQNFSPTNGSSVILPWVPGFPALTDEIGNIDNFVFVTPDPSDSSTALVYFNPYGHGQNPDEMQPIAILPGSMQNLQQLMRVGDTSIAAAMKRNGNLFPLKLMNEYVIDFTAYNNGTIKILPLGNQFDPFEGDRIVITHAPGYMPASSNVDDFFKFVTGQNQTSVYGSLRPYLGATTKYVVRFDNAANIFAAMQDPNESVAKALKRMGSLHIVPAPAPSRAPIETTILQSDYGTPAYKIVTYGTGFNPSLGDKIVIKYAPGFVQGTSDIDHFITFSVAANGTAIFGKLKPSANEAADFVIRIDGAAAALAALPNEPNETIAEALEEIGALVIDDEAPHVPIVHQLTQQHYETGPYKVIRLGDEFNPALGDRIVLTHVPGFNASAMGPAGDIDTFTQFVVNEARVYVRQRPDLASPWRYVARIDNDPTHILANLPDEPNETIAEALHEIGAFSIQPAGP